MISISKAVIKKNNRFLLLKRYPKSKSFPNMWDFPGGKDDLNESPSESVIRETKEETNFDIKPNKKMFSEEYHDDNFDYLLHYFHPEITYGKIQLSSSHTKHKWFLEKEIKHLQLHPSVKIYFEKESNFDL